VRTAIIALLAFAGGFAVGLAMREQARNGRTVRVEVPQRSVETSSESIEIPRGTGVVRGRVLTEELVPLEGVRVVATPQSEFVSNLESRTSGTPWADRRLAEAIAESRWILATRQDAQTDAQGRYEIAGLSDRMHVVGAYLEGYEINTHGDGTAEVRPDAEIEFRARRLVRVEIVLRGAPDAPSKMVSIRGMEYSASIFWRTRSRFVDLEPGPYKFRAQAGRRAEYKVDPIEVEITDALGQRVELTLIGKPSLHGRIRYPEELTSKESVSVYATPARS